MTRVSASKFRHHLFAYLDKVAAGEIVVIERNHQEVARLVPAGPSDWRQKMQHRPQLLVAPEAFVEPLEDVWDDYV